MTRFSNVVAYNSPDGLPSNPWPMKPILTECHECCAVIDTDKCPECGAENLIEYEPDYDSNERECEPDEY